MTDEDKPASEQFDLSEATEPADVEPQDIHEVARELERVPETDLSCHADDYLADLVAACKRIEDAAEEARKDGYEDELDERVDEGQSVGPLRKASGTRRYVTDHAAAFDAVLDAGKDPREVAKVKASALSDVLGDDAEEFVGETEYSYFRRQS